MTLNNLHSKIVLITSGQPSLNPRLVKEADTLVANGYDVTVIYQFWNQWGTDLDDKVIPQKKWNAIRVGGDPHSEKALYFYTRLKLKIAKILIKYIGFKGNIPELALGRTTTQLIKEASKNKADLYIAHNLAALPAAVIAASKHNAKCGFDAEDFHRNEVTDNENSFEYRLTSYIEDKYVPQLNYLSTASPLISEAYTKLYPQLNPKTILNVFPKQNLKTSIESEGALKLFWFSQSIGFDRGLEDVIIAIGALNTFPIELHLLGFHTAETQMTFENFAERMGVDRNKLFFYQPIDGSEIFSFASKFDIGLATEIGVPINRDICLTNKIFTYIHSGLAILASDTSAQKQFLSSFSQIGMVYERKSVASLKNILSKYSTQKDLLFKHKTQAKVCANEKLNWNQEKLKFLTIVNEVINR